jgi:hypothetical protein
MIVASEAGLDRRLGSGDLIALRAVAWGAQEVSCDPLRQVMLEELRRRNIAAAHHDVLKAVEPSRGI